MAVQPREHPSCGLVGLPELAGPSSHPGGRRWTVGSQTGQPEACDHGGRHLGPAPQAGHWAAPAAPDIHVGEPSAAPPPPPSSTQTALERGPTSGHPYWPAPGAPMRPARGVTPARPKEAVTFHGTRGVGRKWPGPHTARETRPRGRHLQALMRPEHWRGAGTHGRGAGTHGTLQEPGPARQNPSLKLSLASINLFLPFEN